MRMASWTKRAACFSALIVMFFGAEPGWAMICSTDADVIIPDGSGSATPGAAASVSIVVPAVYVNPITDLDFLLEIDHTYVGDLIVTLTSPAGTTVTLVNRPGSPTPLGIFGCSGNNINATLDDEAGTAVENQCAGAVPTISGTHSPTDALSGFDGEIPAGTWTLSVTDNAGQDRGTLIAGGSCLDLTTVPVVLSAFKSKRRGRALIADWQTSSEAFNLGFDLWGEVDGDWRQLNKFLIESKYYDSVEPQDYRQRVRLNSLPGDVTAVGISSLSSSGQEEFFGPFEIGESYGELTIPRKIDWQQQRSVYERAMRDAGYLFKRGRWVKATQQRVRREAKNQARYPSVWIDVDRPGIYQISYESLLASGVDLKGLPLHALAMSRDGNAVPRIVNTVNEPVERFGLGSTIEFYAHGPSEKDARYVDSGRYVLSYNPEQVLSAPLISTAMPSADAENRISYFWESVTTGNKNLYSFILPGSQPWYDSTIPAYRSIGRKEIVLSVPDRASLDREALLNLNLLGAVDFPRRDADGDGELEPHHHYKVYLNPNQFPEPIHEGYANGFNPIQLELETAGQLTHGQNTVLFELIPDNGLNLDAAYFIDAGIKYQVNTVMSEGALGIEPVNTEGALTVAVDEFAPHAIFRTDAVGNFVQVEPRSIGESLLSIDLPDSNLVAPRMQFWFLNSSNFLQPRSIEVAQEVDDEPLDLSNVDYVIISDPSLMGDDLTRFVERQDELGRRTKVVNSHHIFQRYSAGLNLPRAIKTYLSEQASTSPFQYVLLVGGHTYNYRGFNVGDAQAPVTLIPSFYREGEGLTRQIPTATPFVDFDNNGSPDRAIGRWPVRNTEQLRNVVNKTLAWHLQGSHRDSKDALLIAGAKETLNEFTGSSDRVFRALGNSLNPWQQPARVYMDDLYIDPSIEAGTEVTVARDRIVDVLNQGAALTVFNGHASPTSWSNQSLMTADVAERLINTDKPSIMMPLACYTTYYETPNVKSMAELLLTDNEAGAVAITSAAMLSRTLDNENFAKALMQSMTVQGMDLGTAVLKVKQGLHQHGGRSQSMIYNWTTLGDPTLSFGLPDVTMPPVVDPPKER